jgi:hypothetical protein
MAVRYQQDLQVSIHERLRRLMAADHEDASHEVRLVTDWIDRQPALRAILAEAQRAEPDLDPEALVSALRDGGRGLSRSFRWPSQAETGRAFLIWHLMRRIAAEDCDENAADRMVLNYGSAVSYHTNVNDKWRDLASRTMRPLFDYLSERVGRESSILYAVERYVHLVEWFARDDLHARATQDPRKAEDVYDAHLRRCSTWAIGSELSTTLLAACSLNSEVYRFGFPDTRSRSFRIRILLDPCPENLGRLTPLGDEPGPATGRSGTYPDRTLTRKPGPACRTQHASHHKTIIASFTSPIQWRPACTAANPRGPPGAPPSPPPRPPGEGSGVGEGLDEADEVVAVVAVAAGLGEQVAGGGQ